MPADSITGTYAIREGKLVKISGAVPRVPECRRFHPTQGQSLLDGYRELENRGEFKVRPGGFTPAQIKAAAALPDT